MLWAHCEYKWILLLVFTTFTFPVKECNIIEVTGQIYGVGRYVLSNERAQFSPLYPVWKHHGNSPSGNANSTAYIFYHDKSWRIGENDSLSSKNAYFISMITRVF